MDKMTTATNPELFAEIRSSGAEIFFRTYDPVDDEAMDNAFASSFAASAV